MSELGAQFHRKLEIVAEIRLRVTGRSLKLPAATSWSVERFDSLVSSIYKLLREAWRDEVEFVQRAAGVQVRQQTEVRRYCFTVSDLRQAEQHDDLHKARSARERWLLDAVGDRSLSADKEREACAVLIREGTSALTSLVGLCKHLERDPSGSEMWADFVEQANSSDPVNALAIVASDLGLGSFSPSKRDYLEREVVKAWSHRARSLAKHDDRSAALEAEVIRLLAGQFLGSIPCGYSDLLDELDIDVGSTEALGAVLLAHGVAMLVDFDDLQSFVSSVSACVAALGRL